MTSTASVKRIKDLPSPKGHFILGHLPQFNANNKHQVLERWVDECGDLFKINFVGKQFIVSADPEMNAEILKMRPTQFRRYAKINEILEEMGVNGVFNAEGETWRRHRKPTSDALSLKKVRGFYPIIAEKTNNLLEKWKTFAEANQPVDVQKELMRYTVDITTAIAFGYQMDTINHKDDAFQKHLEHIFPMVNERITAPMPTWRYLKKKKDRKLDESLAAIEGLIYTFIDEAKARLSTDPGRKETPTNFLEALLVEQEKADKFSDKEIYGNVFSILLAGEDTTSNSLSWTLYFLAQHPEIVEKVRAEAVEMYPNSDLPESDKTLHQLRYANAVAQETLRLKSVTPNLYLQANEDLTIRGFEIPKNTSLMLQNKVAQTRDAHFSNPNDFIPERWIKGGCPMHENHQVEVMRAFGGGPRYCPGMNLAMHEMTITISTLCKHLEFSLGVSADRVTEMFSFTMYPENLLVNLRLR